MFWSLDLRMPSDMQVRLFKRYGRIRHIRFREEMMGIKAGRLCYQIPELVRAFPQLRIIVPERPTEEIVQSQLKSRMWIGWGRKRLLARMRVHRQKRESDIPEQHLDVLRLPYHDTVANPSTAIRRICEFLDIQPTRQQVRAAMDFVSPSLEHFGKPA